MSFPYGVFFLGPNFLTGVAMQWQRKEGEEPPGKFPIFDTHGCWCLDSHTHPGRLWLEQELVSLQGLGSGQSCVPGKGNE